MTKLINIAITRQQVADYIHNDNSDAWVLGNSTIYWVSKNHYQHSSFESGNIETMLNLCSDDDILSFARDEDLVEETA